MQKINLSFVGEFGYEMILSVPYAYWLHANNMLGSTVSSKDTKCFYVFNINHVEYFNSRTGYIYDKPYGGNSLPGNPNETIHVPELNLSKFLMPPYREIYKNNLLKSNKQCVMVSNKFYSSCKKKNIGRHIDLNTLYKIFEILSKNYVVLYNRALENNIVSDINTTDETFGDFELIKQLNRPDIIDVNLLYEQFRSMFSFNTFQCMLKANCEKYVSVQGGTSIFSSLFGGTNIIYADDCMETKFNSYSWYNRFSGTNIIHTKTYDDLLKSVEVL